MGNEERERWLSELRGTVGESEKNWGVALTLSIFLGFFGADMFYLDRMWLGFVKLVTFGGFGIWWMVDVARLLLGKMRDGDGGLVRRPF